MSKSLLQKIDRERSLTQAREVKVIEQLCRITLAADAPHHVDVEWCEGLGKKKVLYVFEPGKPVMWKLSNAISFFGPFTLFEIYEKTSEENKRIEIRDIIAKETARVLDRYLYPCDDRTGKPIGPHRLPDFSIEIINSDGDVSKPYRLYELYGVGEFDDIVFDHKPTTAEIEGHYQAKLLEEARLRDEALGAARREIAELRGMILGKAQPAAAAASAAPKARTAHNAGKRNPHKAGCQCAAHRGKNRPAELVEA